VEGAFMTSQKQKEAYRVEQIGNKYYLTRDINIAKKRKKIRKLIGTSKPTEKELQQFIEKNTETIETEAFETETNLSLTTYKLNYLDQKTAKKLENTRTLYKKFTKILPINEIETYEQEIEIKYVHGTTIIEGNTLTEEQTRNLLTKGTIPDDKQNIREINEVQNFKTVKKYRDNYKGKITSTFIKKLHAMIIHNIDIENAGQYRKKKVSISGREKPVTSHEFIELALLEIIENYYTALKNGNNPFEEAVIFHHKFESIHPFLDGNGRVGREIFNFMLHKTGYPRFSVLKTTREAYLKLLQLGDEEKYQDMIVHFAYLFITQETVNMISKALDNWLSEKKVTSVSYNLAPQIVEEWATNINDYKKSEKQ
jgi:fido (protein-threonine AMPylation protein)